MSRGTLTEHALAAQDATHQLHGANGQHTRMLAHLPAHTRAQSQLGDKCAQGAREATPYTTQDIPVNDIKLLMR